VKLTGRNTAFHLTEEGKAFFHHVTGEGPWDTVSADVEETDDVGIWLRMERGGGSKFLLLRWEFILGIEVRDEKGKVVGLRG
jgi:hypothetical protein